MTEPSQPLEARLAAIECTLAAMDARLQVIEMASGPRAVSPVAVIPATRAAASATDIAGTFTLMGRTFVIIAGAYVLRAATEAGIVDRATGAVLGMAYAVVWTAAAYRVAPRKPFSAMFYGACTVLIGFPLLWEATTRFALLRPMAGALALTAVTAVVLVAAWRRYLQPLAWLATIAACLMASPLMVVTGGAVPFSSFLIVLGVATLWLGYDREWTQLRWVAAFFADLAVVALIGGALATPARDAPSQVMAVQLLLLVGYLGSIVIRTLVRGRDVVPFEAVQTVAMLMAGLAGALVVAHRTGAGALMLGPVLLVLSAACYAVATSARWHVTGANHAFYTSLGLVFALTGGELALDGTPMSLLWVVLAVLAGWSARRYGSRTLGLHSVVYVTAAALSSGLLAASFSGLVSPFTQPWTPLHAASWAALAGLGLCWVLSTDPARTVHARVDVLRLTFAILVVVNVSGVCAIVLRLLLPPASSPLAAAIVATLRTGVLSTAALIVAWLGRHAAAREAGVLLYPVLAVGGLKLLLEDFRVSPPLLLVVALTLYGVALILGPRIARIDSEPRTADRAWHATKE